MTKRNSEGSKRLALGLREYRHGTFDKRVAYGQRERKLMLVARGIMKGFFVRCESERKAASLALGLKVRARHLESREGARFGLRVKLVGRTVYVTRTPK